MSSKGQHGTKAEKARRVHKVYKMLVDGADYQGIVLAAEQLGWDVSSRTIDTYVAEARSRLEEESAAERELELGRAKARLNNLYGRSLLGKDLRGALAVQREINELLGLKAAKEVTLTITDEALIAERDRLRAELAKRSADA